MKMRKTISSLLMGATSLLAMAQGGEFTLQGTLVPLGDSVAVALIDPMSGKAILEQNVALEAPGVVDLSFDMTGVGQLHVMRFDNGKPDPNVSISMPAVPGEHATITGMGEGYRVGGTQFYQDYSDAMDAIEEPQAAYYALLMDCQNRLQQGESQDQVMKTYNERGPALQQALSTAALNYIKAHPDQLASAALVTTAGNDVEQTASLLSQRVQDNDVSVLYRGVIEQQKREAADAQRRNALEGKTAPEFTLIDINGRPLSLSQLRGKWVILDFWGSWCKWCVQGMPDLKECYKRHKGELEVLGIDCNESMEKWKAAVDKLDLPWKHVYNPGEGDENPVKLYAVRGFPTKVIIDPQGVVYKVVMGEDPDFYNVLERAIATGGK